MAQDVAPEAYSELFADLAPDAFDDLWPWQETVLSEVAESEAEDDLAVELPTGAGKTVIALLVAEEFRRRTSQPVAYLTGTRQLTRQVAAEACRLGVPAVSFSGPKSGWDQEARTDYEFATAVGVMNFWNYFNESPGVGPAQLLILDDVHLAEGPLRDFFTVTIPSAGALFSDLLQRIRGRFPYYGLVNDLLDGLQPQMPAEMLAPPDVVEVADDVRAILDARLADGSASWWSWQRIRQRCGSCCWIVSPRAFTITPWSPPSQTIEHFATPGRRLYLSATVGDVEDLRRRIGCRRVRKLVADVPPRQGRRWVAISDSERALDAEGVVHDLTPFLRQQPKALWLAARHSTADRIENALEGDLEVTTWRLEGEGEATESFAAADQGHLIAAGRYDGMDFPDEACRLEVVPELPVATSDLEEFISSYLRDAGFAQGRLAQRVAQALGRCNRSTDDRAIYLLWDPAFRARFGTREGLALLPAEVRADVFAAVRRDGALSGAADFLSGSDPDVPPMPPLPDAASASSAKYEVRGILELWGEDFQAAAESFGRVAAALDGAREYRAFWLVQQATALLDAGVRYGDEAAGRRGLALLAEALAIGIPNTFFSRLRASQARLAQAGEPSAAASYDRVFAAWDKVLDRFAPGPQLEAYRARLLDDLAGDNHDVAAEALGRLGELLGYATEVPSPEGGEPDCLWNLSEPRRRIVIEVKLPERRTGVSNDDVEQHEGAIRARSDGGSIASRGLLVTSCTDVDDTAEPRIERGRIVRQADLAEWAAGITELLAEYSRGWSGDAAAREERRRTVEPRLPPVDLLWDLAGAPGPWFDFAES